MVAGAGDRGEEARLAALRTYGILDTPPEQGFDDIVALASRLCAAPVALVSLLDRDRQWFKAAHGFGASGTPIGQAICAHALGEPELLVIPDLATDPRTRDNPLVTAGPRARFYAGAPLRTPEGVALGTVCVLDTAPRPGGLDAGQSDALVRLARQVMALLEMRRAALERARSETRLAVLDALSRAIAPLGEADAILAATTRILGTAMGVSVCAYADMDEDQDGFTIRGDWAAPGSRSITGHYSLAAFGERAVARLGAGEPLVLRDIAAELPAHEAATFLGIGLKATICLPLVKAGRLTALMAVHQADPRDWTADDVALLHEATERSWAHVERAGADSLRRESEARYRTLFESIDEGFCVIEFLDGPHGPLSDYVHVEANPAYEKHAGIPNVVGRTLRALVPDEAEGWLDLYGGVLRTGTPIRFERELVATGRHLELAAFRIEPPERRQVAVIFRDMTARRLAEARLRELNESLEAEVAARTAERDRIWENSRDLLAVADAGGVIQTVNPAWTRVLGWEPAELIGRRTEWIEHPDDLAPTEAELGHLGRGDQTGSFENRLRTRDGAWRRFSWAAVPEGGRIYAAGRDVTAERERQAELEAAQDQLRQAQKMEAVGQLTGGLAHDFNNLLAGIAGSLDLIGRRVEQGRASEVGRYLDAAQDAARRAGSLTHRLLAFSRRQALAPQPTDLGRLALGMEDLVRRSVGPGIEVRVLAEPGRWTALVDPSQLENALLNLCLNARDAMPEGGRLTVSVGTRPPARRRDGLGSGEHVRLSVIDTGEGMSPEVVARAFEPFFTTKPQGQGTGLGLSMVYGFARQSGGAVSIDSVPGQGTTVSIDLPRRAGAAEAPAPSARAAQGGTGEAVLVVDDEPVVRLFVTDLLRDAGYRVAEAGDGPEALERLPGLGSLDLLVTDVGLPGGLNGRQLADRVREARPGLPVLFITGYAEAAAWGEGRLAEGQAVLTKPFESADLLARVRAALAR